MVFLPPAKSAHPQTGNIFCNNVNKINMLINTDLHIPPSGSNARQCLKKNKSILLREGKALGKGRPYSTNKAARAWYKVKGLFHSDMAPVFICLFLFSLGVIPAQSAWAQDTFTETRYFQGVVRRDMAERVALAAAEQQALKSAVRELAKQPDLQFVHEGNAASVPPLEGLAAKLYGTEILVLGIQGFPPNVQTFVELRLNRPDNLRNDLRIALQQEGALELYALIFAREARLIALYDELAREVLPLPPHAGGGQEIFYTLQGIVRNLDALALLKEALKAYGKSWSNPEEAHVLLSKANNMAQSDPLIRVALAEVLLQLNRPAEAMEHASLAASAEPELARAHDAKGMVFLRQFLPSLAAESFSTAILLAPKNAVYYAHRASAYLIQEETEKMCADFQSACSLGTCEGLQWGQRSGKCSLEESTDEEEKLTE